MPSLIQKISGCMYAMEVVLGCYMTFITVVILLFRADIPDWKIFLAYHAMVAAAVAGIIYAHETTGRNGWNIARHWYPLATIMCAFRELYFLVHAVNPIDMDALLASWDKAILGVDPTVFIEQHIAFPALTEYLQIVYSLFYFVPIGIGFILWRRGRENHFRLCTAGVMAGFFTSYVGFFILPAIGPRFLIHDGVTLPGVWSAQWINDMLNTLELRMRDCFPSGHVEVSVIALWYAWKYERRWFPVFMVVVGSLVFSTVYLRYHYVVDVIAGIALAAAVVILTRVLHNWWEVKNDRDACD